LQLITKKTNGKNNILEMICMSFNQERLFTVALGLEKPWHVERIEFTPEEQRIDLYPDFKRGSKFHRSGCGKETPVYDSEERTWRPQGNSAFYRSAS
jgi:hypothetical protein